MLSRPAFHCTGVHVSASQWISRKHAQSGTAAAGAGSGVGKNFEERRAETLRPLLAQQIAQTPRIARPHRGDAGEKRRRTGERLLHPVLATREMTCGLLQPVEER